MNKQSLEDLFSSPIGIICDSDRPNDGKTEISGFSDEEASLFSSFAQDEQNIFRVLLGTSRDDGDESDYGECDIQGSYIPRESQCSEITWGEWDVPLGRSQPVREHIGNVRFRSLVEEHRQAYQKANRKSEKTRISAIVFKIIKSNGGRFLDKRKGNNVSPKGVWYEIPDEKAQAKVSQALRNGTRPIRNHKHPLSPTAPPLSDEQFCDPIEMFFNLDHSPPTAQEMCLPTCMDLYSEDSQLNSSILR
mmetsp:Transcript_20626/g.26597  ORF Transcript_20626/g.26597 Transcript_20626/m.26597 type:complete len:248 (-) Transcript_20626:141-884(-)|eukprot:CAMPEP_0198154478 /NCGR_PEP_ID=MMETSP1443-20131203/68619_1 /TAXON_ID=186043 /ORGANISM="Entomoneis sp., Strain CCMP2396" /LENGTH=247 /DNA_ID=CAMNT_0043821157 /DNA_START=144 /DNA_END=887 /DNA_ORIENTATION=+